MYTYDVNKSVPRADLNLRRDSRPGSARSWVDNSVGSPVSGMAMQPVIQRMAKDDAEEPEDVLMRSAASGAPAAASVGAPAMASVEGVIGSPGRSLDAETAGYMGARFNRDFGDVRIHTDARGAESARQVDARAYTVGNHVVFGAGEYSPATTQGKTLIAHELAHVAQQGGQLRRSPMNFGMSSPGDAAEVEAEAAAHAVVNDRPARVGQRGTTQLARQQGPNIAEILRQQRIARLKGEVAKWDREIAKWSKPNAGRDSYSNVARAIAVRMDVEHDLRIEESRGASGGYAGQKYSGTVAAGVQTIDCTTYVLRVLRFTFEKLGRKSDFDAIFKEAKEASDDSKRYPSNGGFKGLELLMALQSRGWHTIYWNPNTANTGDRGEHSTSYSQAKKGYYIQSRFKVDKETSHMVLDYNAGARTKDDSLKKMQNLPFGVIAARGGTHMTLLISGWVYEVHWDKAPNDPNVIQATPLKAWEWLSGVIVVPPGDFEKFWK